MYRLRRNFVCFQGALRRAYRDRDTSHRASLPHHAAYGSVLRGSADQAESDIFSPPTSLETQRSKRENNLDDLKLHELFNSIPDFIHFLGKESQKKYAFIDEVQRLENPGLFLKEIYDLNLNIKIIYSGSSQLEVKSNFKEHLVGRARQFEIHRLAFKEYLHFAHPITRKQALEDMLIYGSYPAVAMEMNKTEKKLSIKDIYQSYVEKDLVDFLRVDNVNAFNNLLVLLANQIGSLLSIDSLSKSLRISRNQTEKYISILENTFIIKRIYPYHKNYKKEITKTPKTYFMDLGLRNFVINNFNSLALRNDQGDLFYIFLFLKKTSQTVLS
ncbi:MAG: AAA family ATPase [Deltaproteobacteria bacterium]|nr:AAA family ATPase [Deltaproteobacteria bacterium]